MAIRQRLPKDRRDWLLTIGIACAAGGFVLVGLAWNGAAGKDSIQEQFPYVLSGGIGGLMLVILGTGLIVLQSFRRDHDRVSEELAELRETMARSTSTAGSSTSPQPKLTIAGGAGMVVAGKSSFHTPGCRLAKGRGEENVMAFAEAEALGLEPCRVCKPAS